MTSCAIGLQMHLTETPFICIIALVLAYLKGCYDNTNFPIFGFDTVLESMYRYLQYRIDSNAICSKSSDMDNSVY